MRPPAASGTETRLRSPVLLKAVPGTEIHLPPVSSTIPTSESVIRVFNIPAITWTLTLFLLAGGTYYILRAIRSRRTTDRINHGLHALMHTLMAAMLWNAIPSTTLVQIAVLAAATLWFIIQAVARPQFRTFCAGTQDRLKCLYHSLTMAAAALMIAMMAIPGAATTGATRAPP